MKRPISFLAESTNNETKTKCVIYFKEHLLGHWIRPNPIRSHLPNYKVSGPGVLSCWMLHSTHNAATHQDCTNQLSLGSKHKFMEKQGKQCFLRWNRCVRFKVIRLSSSIPCDLRHAEQLLFLCPCSNLTVYRRKFRFLVGFFGQLPTSISRKRFIRFT